MPPPLVQYCGLWLGLPGLDVHVDVVLAVDLHVVVAADVFAVGVVVVPATVVASARSLLTDAADIDFFFFLRTRLSHPVDQPLPV